MCNKKTRLKYTLFFLLHINNTQPHKGAVCCVDLFVEVLFQKPVQVFHLKARENFSSGILTTLNENVTSFIVIAILAFLQAIEIMEIPCELSNEITQHPHFAGLTSQGSVKAEVNRHAGKNQVARFVGFMLLILIHIHTLLFLNIKIKCVRHHRRKFRSGFLNVFIAFFYPLKSLPLFRVKSLELEVVLIEMQISANLNEYIQPFHCLIFLSQL